MTTAVPREIRSQIQKAIWEKADALNWGALSDIDRASWYENWSKDKSIGGVLAHFMDARKVRVYIKDSLLRPYSRSRLEANIDKIFCVVGVDRSVVQESAVFSKPHGRRLLDGRVICWGRSRDWRSVVISVFERARMFDGATPFAAVLVEMGSVTSPEQKKFVIDVANRLGISRIQWLA